MSMDRHGSNQLDWCVEANNHKAVIFKLVMCVLRHACVYWVTVSFSQLHTSRRGVGVLSHVFERMYSCLC